MAAAKRFDITASPRALLAVGWFCIVVVTTLAFITALLGQTRLNRAYSPFDFAHFTFLALSPFVVDVLIRWVPLRGRFFIGRVLLHMLFASAVSALAGGLTGFTMGWFDQLKGYQHIINSFRWFLDWNPSRAKTLLIEQMLYFANAACLDAMSRIAARREAELHAAQLQAETTRLAYSAATHRIPADHLRETFRAIADQAAGDPRQAERIIVALARFLRLSLDASTRPELTRGQEVEIARALVELEGAKQGRTVPLHCTIDPSALEENIDVPSLVQELIAARAELRTAESIEVRDDGGIARPFVVPAVVGEPA